MWSQSLSSGQIANMPEFSINLYNKLYDRLNYVDGSRKYRLIKHWIYIISSATTEISGDCWVYRSIIHLIYVINSATTETSGNSWVYRSIIHWVYVMHSTGNWEIDNKWNAYRFSVKSNIYFISRKTGRYSIYPIGWSQLSLWSFPVFSMWSKPFCLNAS